MIVLSTLKRVTTFFPLLRRRLTHTNYSIESRMMSHCDVTSINRKSVCVWMEDVRSKKEERNQNLLSPHITSIALIHTLVSSSRRLPNASRAFLLPGSAAAIVLAGFFYLAHFYDESESPKDWHFVRRSLIAPSSHNNNNNPSSVG
jgi:hypothetical protein